MRTLNEYSRFVKEKYSNGAVVASVLVGTFTGVRYVVNLTDTINHLNKKL